MILFRHAVPFPHHREEGIERFRRKTRGHSLLSDHIRRHRMVGPIIVPYRRPSLLHLLRRQEETDARHLGDRPSRQETIHGAPHGFVTTQRLVHRSALRHTEALRQARLRLARQLRHPHTLVGRHIVDSVHIRLELGLGAEIEEREGQKDDQAHRHLVLLELDIGDLAEHQLTTRPPLEKLIRKEMRQHEENEENRTHKKQGGEEPHVAHRLRTDEEEAEEGAHRRDIARHERIHDVAHRLLTGMPLLEVRQKMQRVIHRNAHDDGTYANRDDRNVPLQQRHESQTEQ